MSHEKYEVAHALGTNEPTNHDLLSTLEVELYEIIQKSNVLRSFNFA